MEVLMQNKQEKTVISSKRELAGYVFQMLTETESKTEMSEDEKRRMEARIIAKLKAGKKLTGEEMDFLRRYNTELGKAQKLNHPLGFRPVGLPVLVVPDGLFQFLNHRFISD